MRQLDLFRSTTQFDPSLPLEIVGAMSAKIDSVRSIVAHNVIHPSNVKHIFPSFTDRKTWTDPLLLDININTKRIKLFDLHPSCSCCGRPINMYVVEQQAGGDQPPYLNAYSVDGDQVHEMTVDHMLPQAAGGNDSQHNRTTMCQPCNNGKTVLMSLAEIETVMANTPLYTKPWVNQNFVKTLLLLQKYAHSLEGKRYKQAVGIIKACAQGLSPSTKPSTYKNRIDRMESFMDCVQSLPKIAHTSKTKPNWVHTTVDTITQILLTFFPK